MPRKNAGDLRNEHLELQLEHYLQEAESGTCPARTTPQQLAVYCREALNKLRNRNRETGRPSKAAKATAAAAGRP